MKTLKNFFYVVGYVLILSVAIFGGCAWKLYVCDGAKNHTMCMLSK